MPVSHSNVGTSIRIYLMKSRSLFPLHLCNGMMESRTPRTVIFDQLQVCLEAVQDTQQADVLFVFVRLLSSEFIDVAARITAIDSLWNRYNLCFRDGNGCFPLGIRKASWSRP
jgi:hypothetical protein